MSNSDSPYVGPRPFMKGDENVFYGRDAEAQALTSLIVSHSAVLLYSQSGAGKTSLLNTKVRSFLEGREVHVLGSSRVGGSLPPNADPAQIANIFVYFALSSLEGDEPITQSCNGKTTLLEYLEKIPRRTRSDGGLVQRVIFFDQFEEIFTTSHHRWENREGFFEQVGLALEADKQLRVVFAMRQEYLASLTAHVSQLPERLRTRFHLERLRYEQALDAVTKPLEGTRRQFAPGVAEQLVQNLMRVPVRSDTGFQEITGEFVEPVQLQVVCQNIWNSLPDGVTEVNAKFIESSGDVDVALTNYYEDCLKRLIEKHPINESRLRRWFDHELITQDGLRGTVYQGHTTTGTLPNDVVSMLQNLQLVRAEPRGGALWYELTHDRFIAPIRKSNRTWFTTQQGDLGSFLEMKAAEYKKDPRDENLIRGSELNNALDWLKTADADGAEVSESVRTYIVDSKNGATKRRARGLRRQVGALALLLLVALGFGAWAYWEKRNAERARFDERAEVAKSMIDLKKYHDALVWGLKSVEPAITKGTEPSQQSINNLRNALKAVGGGVWSRTFSSRPIIAISNDGQLIFTADDKEWVVWRGADGQRIFSQQLNKEQDKPAGGQKPDQTSARERSRVISAFFSPSGNFLAIRTRIMNDTSTDTVELNPISQYEVWDLRNSPRQVITDRGAYTLQFANNDARLLLVGREGIRVVELPDKIILSLPRKAESTFLSPSGQKLLQISHGALVFRNVSQTDTKIERVTFPTSGGEYQFAFSADGTKLALFEDNNNKTSPLTLWDTESGKILDKRTIDSAGVFYSLNVVAGNAVLLLAESQTVEVSKIPALQIWDVNKNTQTAIDEKLKPIYTDDEMWYLMQNDATSKIIVVDPRDRSTWVEFKDLPNKPVKFLLSKQITAAITLNEDNLMQYWQPGRAMIDVDNLSPNELYRMACDRLRYQEKEFGQVSALCERVK